MTDSADFRSRAVLAALAKRPDGAALLSVRAPRAAVVGGFVRDTLLGLEPREIDVVVEGSAEELARAIGGRVTIHPAFGTARAEHDGWAIDIAGARTERYPAAGALPVVAPASIEEDLARRDFTVNAIAVPLADGEPLAAPSALEDLAARRLRVLHDASFTDDPTRLMRLVRYAHRLGFEVEPHTRTLADAATLDTVSEARVGGDLRLILGEPEPLGPLTDLQTKLPLNVDRGVIERARALAPDDARADLVLLAAVTRQRATDAWIAGLELTADERDVVSRAREAEALAATMNRAASPSELRDALRGVPVEVVVIAGALGAAEAAAAWFTDIRHVELEIGGQDLIAAGVPQGAAIGRRLDRTLRRKLDGEIARGRAAELASALGDDG